ncbi:MAG: MotA/TolQ/ExbB proton channel family protein [Candidatus Eisenbacteria bacterium]
MARIGRNKWFFVLQWMILAGFLCAQPVAAQDRAAPGAVGALSELDDTLGALTDTLSEEPTDSLAAGAGFADLEEDTSFLGKIASSGLVELFHNGGNFMWPLLALSLIGLAVLIERLITLFRAKTNVRKLVGQVVAALHSDGIEGAKRVCESTRGPIAAILHAGLMKAHHGRDDMEKAIQSAGTIEMSFLERGLVVLSSVATIGPLLGFLGTVSGMIHAFEAIAAAEQVNAKLVATGISEALITTATGLIIAIPAQAAYNFFIAQIDRFVIEMEEASTEMIDNLLALEEK